MKLSPDHSASDSRQGEVWTRRAARRLRDWLDGYLGNDIQPNISASQTGPEQPPATASRPAEPPRFPPLPGPPPDWLERVRKGAPELLLSPEEGGTPWLMAQGQSEETPQPFPAAPSSQHLPPATQHHAQPVGERRPRSSEKLPQAAGQAANPLPSAATRERKTLADRFSSMFRKTKQPPRKATQPPEQSRSNPAPPRQPREAEPRPHSAPPAAPLSNAAPLRQFLTRKPDIANQQQPTLDDHAPAEAAPPRREANPRIARKGPTRLQSGTSNNIPAQKNPLPSLAAPPAQQPPQSAKVFDDIPSRMRSTPPLPEPWPFSPSAAQREVRSPTAFAGTRNRIPISLPVAPDRNSPTPASIHEIRAANSSPWSHWAEAIPESEDLWPDLPQEPSQAGLDLEQAVRDWERSKSVSMEQRGES